MLQVALITENYPPETGGIAASAARLAATLAGTVHIHLVKFPRCSGEEPEKWITEQPAPGLSIHTVTPFVNGWKQPNPGLRPALLDRTARRIAEVLGSGVDLIHGFGLQNAGIAAAQAALLMKRPLIQSVRGNDAGRNSFDGTRRLALRAALRAADVIVSVNIWLANLICWQWPDLANRVRVIPNGVCAFPFEPNGDLAVARQSLGIPLDGPVAGIVGSIREKKGPHILDAVLAKCLQPRNGCLLVIGEIQLEHFHALGWTASLDKPGVKMVRAASAPDLRQWIEVCDWCLFPSLDDGMANGLLEALERSRPVVASPVYRDVIEHGKHGLIASPLRPAEFVAAGNLLCSDPSLRSALGAGGRLRVTNDFNSAAERGAWEAVYRGCAGRP